MVNGIEFGKLNYRTPGVVKGPAKKQLKLAYQMLNNVQ